MEPRVEKRQVGPNDKVGGGEKRDQRRENRTFVRALVVLVLLLPGLGRLEQGRIHAQLRS